MPIRILVTEGTLHDSKKAIDLIKDIKAEYLLADRGYDSNEIVNKAIELGMKAVIPPKKNRIEQRIYDKHLYKLRHLVENAFMRLKEWRGIATRYAKHSKSFLNIVFIRCMIWWAKVGGKRTIDDRL